MFRRIIESMFGPKTIPLADQIRDVELRLRLKALEVQAQLMEETADAAAGPRGPMPVPREAKEAANTAVPASYYDQLVDPREPLYDETDFWLPLGYSENLPTNLDNRRRGEVLPIYLTEYGLKVIRDMSRKQAAFNEFAINALENRISYIVGKGIQYKVLPKKGLEDDANAQACATIAQTCIDRFMKRNAWGELEQECVLRTDRDGEVFIRLFHVGEGQVEARVVEPEWVRSPADAGAQNSFGIQTDPDDVEFVVGYWIIQNPQEGYYPELTDASEIVHIKLNSQRNAKRGVPTFLPVRKNLDRADRLLRNMSMLAQIQSTFALIRRHKQFTGSAIQTFSQNSADVQVATPVTGQTKYLQQFPPGSVVDASQNTEYEFPAVGVNAGALVEILQAELRAIASRLVMPEYMLTSDASNANYASTLVAEAPSTRNFERLQATFCRKFGDGTFESERHAGVMWRVLKLAIDYGELPREALALLEIQAEGPTLVARDKVNETKRSESLSGAGLLSLQTWSKQEGLDFDQEQRLRTEETELRQTMRDENMPPEEEDDDVPDSERPDSDESHTEAAEEAPTLQEFMEAGTP